MRLPASLQSRLGLGIGLMVTALWIAAASITADIRYIPAIRPQKSWLTSRGRAGYREISPRK